MSSALVIQTAFAGDLVLTLPLIQELARLLPDTSVDVLCIPSTAALLRQHPSVRDVIVYDKQRRTPGLWAMARDLRRREYSLCISPHRSLRSALLARGSGASRRVGFDRSAGRALFTEIVRYDAHAHEVLRNLRLLERVVSGVSLQAAPRLYPSEADVHAMRDVVARAGGPPFVCIAPGSVWATKRWTPEGFAVVARSLASRCAVVLVGGDADHELCARIAEAAGTAGVLNAAGRLSFLGSAALIGAALLLVSNDSAPVHLASAMGTPVVELYGATSPAFGFGPWEVPHRIVQREDLTCRPCRIHGGDACPLGTFACMKELEAHTVIAAVDDLLEECRSREHD